MLWPFNAGAKSQFREVQQTSLLPSLRERNLANQATLFVIFWCELPVARFSKDPLYLQVRDSLAKRIGAGEWKPHDMLPNEIELARELGVSAGTARKALDVLEADGLIIRRQGKGTQVADLDSLDYVGRYTLLVDVDGARLLGQVHATFFDRGLADVDEQARLKVGPHAQVIRMTRVRTQAGVPFMIEAVRMPADLLEGISDAELSRSFLTQWALARGFELGAGGEGRSATKTEPGFWYVTNMVWLPHNVKPLGPREPLNSLSKVAHWCH